MAQLPQRLGFDLTDPLSGNVELFTHFLQSTAAAILNAKTQFEDFFLPRGERAEYIYQLFFPVTSGSTVLQEFGYGAAVSIVAALIVGGVTLLYLFLARRLDKIME